ncbi:hypothetical protein KDN24_17515 [Bacillus sp. Bva_UNVM-123]|uniref:hypothetical protein n=1 Tax=Bacillus sp. Bva_UNVM-123 TaxID=2829798 RepID=UPI00391FA23E
MGAFLLGPFMIKHIYIIILLAAITAYLMMKWKTREEPAFQKVFLNVFVNAVFIWFIIFKFSSIIFQPTNIMNNPTSILYFTGGLKGSVLGLIFAIVYLLWHYKKGTWSLKSWLSTLVYGIVTFMIIFWLLRTLFFLIF